MEVRAVTKYVRVQPRKVRIVADEVRGKAALYTVNQLRYHPSKAAFHLRKTLISAIHNAVNNHGLPLEELRIAKITIDEGPRAKRIEQRAMGRAYRILKKTSHITVVVDQAEATGEIKPHGTKAKARPTFAAPKKRGGAKKAKADETATVAAAAEETSVAEPEEAKPVTEADAREEAGSATPVSEQEETTPQAEGATGDEQKGEE
ncbi:MAG: large subunit ribosomal protein [Fimbriimonadaceae bacterium]|jgi:large subunit ribosomal protein L22|nr:large subunit ribosomal protein [Fimbriimonadaceae bacterium]